MTLSMVLAWATVLLVCFTAGKYIARKSKSVKLNLFFRKVHNTVGIAAVILGLAHGLLAGNVEGVGLSEIHIGGALFSLNWGTVCFILIVLLWGTYLFRRVLKKNWMRLHRIFTIALLAVLALHIVEVGIRLPARISHREIIDENVVETIENKVNEEITFSGARLADGVYEGTSQGYKSEIKVSVRVENGTVSEIEILDENDTPNYFDRAKSIINDIIDEQSLSVDAVSGATYSSAGILNAVRNALESAVSGGELEQGDITYSNDFKHEKGNKHGGQGESEEKGMEYKTITMEEASEIFATEGDYIILDVRRRDEFDAGHIPGAINIANESIGDTEIKELPDKEQVIYVYCRSGNRSKQAADKLVKLGYTNIIECGGILDWNGEPEY